MMESIKIVILGYMGSGKSLVGAELASKLGYSFVDLDSEIEKQEGMMISELFQQKGEIYFRKKEIETLKECINSKEKMVIALGGGTPCYGDTMKYLTSNENVITFYLSASIETLTERLYKQKTERPLISHLETKNALNDFVRKHLFERSSYYNEATYTIDSTSTSVSQQIHDIVLQLF
jgi:shikimate kinase